MAQRDLVFGRKIRGNRDGDAPARNPFHAPGKQRLKTDAFQVWTRLLYPCMPKHGDIDATPPIGMNPIHRFVLLGNGRTGICEKVEAIYRSVLPVRQLLRRMHPDAWHTARHGMMWVTHMDRKIKAGWMIWIESLPGRDFYHLVVVSNVHTGAKADRKSVV